MAAIQLGWALSGRSWGNTTRDMFLNNVDKGFKIIDGHLDSVWFTDHLQSDASPVLEGWTTLTYFMGFYPHLTFGHTVLSQSFRNPALLAKMGATLHYLSRGRFILGIGTGWKKDEYLAYGYDFPPPKARIEQLEEALQIIKALWREEQVTFHGKHYHVVNAYCEPKPVPQPLIMIGGCKPRMLRLIARHADWWNVSWYSLDKTRPDNWSNGSCTGIGEYREQVQECELACQEVGRDAAKLRRTWFGPCICAPTEAEVQKPHELHVRTDHGFAGTPEQVIEQMQPFIELGVDYFMFTCPDFPDLTTLALLANEVLPVLNQKNQASRT
jgi:alkanesulfonate monooxygenase SsuD/methylene tetrahydromethanopterin reductase-like flavin-dependent oxidoreductase (luciferase family)